MSYEPSLQGITAHFDKVLTTVEELLPSGWLQVAKAVPNNPLQESQRLSADRSVENTAEAFAATHKFTTTASAAAAKVFLYTLGWKIGNRLVTFETFTVKMGTNIQLASRPTETAPQRKKFEKFSKLAFPEAPQDPDSVQRLLSRIWARPCDGHTLQVLWRLALNGLPTAERDKSLLLQPCGCNLTIGITRTHLYHECVIVKPTWLSVQTRLCGEFSIPAPGLLQRHHIWMAVKPHPQLHQGIWDIVALHLLAAFDSGRRNWVDRIIKLQSAAADVAQGGRSGRRQNRSTRTNGSVHRPKLTTGPEMIAVVSQVV